MVWLLGALMGLLALLLWKTIGSSDNALDWSDLVTETGNKHVSLEKVLLIVIASIGSWAVITMAYSGKLSWEIFSAYLALGGGAKGFSTYIAARFGNNSGGK